MKIYKYKTTFAYDVCFKPKEDCERIKASLTNLSELIPSDAPININQDLIYNVFNGAIANQFNKNGDGIDGATAVAISKYFTHKPIDIEHNQEKVVGHIISAGFSALDEENKLITDLDFLSNTKEPFNLSFGAVAYKEANKEFADFLEANPNRISASWELGVNDFVIAKGKSYNLKDCVIISDPKQIIDMIPYMKAYGGNGTAPDGEYVHRLIVGKVLPLGMGYVMRPAADVSGIEIINSEIKVEDDSEAIEVAAAHIKAPKMDFNVKDFINTSYKEMNLIIAKLKEALGESVTEQSFASITELIENKIKECEADYAVKLQEEINAKTIALAEADRLVSELDALKVQFATMSAELMNLKEGLAEMQKQQVFNERMDSINQEYDLNEEDCASIAKELSTLPLDEDSFGAYKSNFAKVYLNKNRIYIAEQAKILEAKISAEVEKRLKDMNQQPGVSCASVSNMSNLETALAGVSPVNTEIPNASQTDQDDAITRIVKSLAQKQTSDVKIIK